jgi:HK97 family phage major capsid protein
MAKIKQEIPPAKRDENGESMENKNITLSSSELKEIFKKAIHPFTDVVSEMKAIAEKAGSESIGLDAREKLLRENSDYRFSALLTAIKKGDEETISKIEAIEKAADPMNEGAAGDGGYLVPALTEQSMRELIPTVGQAYKYCQVMPLSTGNPINLPKESTLPTAYWVAENAAITESQPEIGVDTVSPKKVVCIPS